MPRWKASCWLGSKSGFVDLEVTANTSNGAIEQMRNIYGAQLIRNIHQVRSRDGNTSSSESSSSGGSLLLLGMIAAGMLFLYFTPWVLMIAYGAATIWVAEKLVGQSLREYGKGRQAWDGWGGDPGRRWATSLARRMDAAERRVGSSRSS